MGIQVSVSLGSRCSIYNLWNATRLPVISDHGWEFGYGSPYQICPVDTLYPALSSPLLTPKSRAAGREFIHSTAWKLSTPNKALSNYYKNNILKVNLGIFSGLHLGRLSKIELFCIWWAQNWNNLSSTLRLPLTMRREAGNEITASTNLKDRTVWTSRDYSATPPSSCLFWPSTSLGP